MTSTEETFQSFSHENDSANLDILQDPDRSLETKGTPVKHPENTELRSAFVASQDECELDNSGLVASPEDCESDIPEEESVLVISAEGNETFAICKDDESRNGLLAHRDTVCHFTGDPSQGLCAYLNLAPNVETEEQKLNALDELIRKSWEIEALVLVEKAPRVSNDHSDPSANWMKTEKEAAQKMNIKYIPESKQFQMSTPWTDDPLNFRKSNHAAFTRHYIRIKNGN